MKFEVDFEKAASAIERAANSVQKNAVGLALVIGAGTGFVAVCAVLLLVAR